MSNTITIHGMEFYAHHGCFAEERIVGTHFKVDVTLYTSIDFHKLEDNIDKTVSYLDVYQDIKSIMNTPVNLLETVCCTIISTIKEKYSLVTEVEVSVHKLNPPLGGKMDSVAVTLRG